MEDLPLETVILHTVSLGSGKEQISALSRALLSLWEPLRKCTETEFEFTLEDNVWKSFPRVMSHFCDTSEAKKYLLFDLELASVTLE